MQNDLLRDRFPHMTDEEFGVFNNAWKYYDKVVKNISLNDEEILLQNALTERVNEIGGPLADSLFHTMSIPVYEKALLRITGYRLESVWNGTFPFTEYPTLGD